jgi:hypothetical protein
LYNKLKNNNLEHLNTSENASSGAFRINWGTGIIISFVLFISFIMYFVLTVQSNSKYDNELVVEEYYKHDAHFGDEMIRIQNAHDLIQKPSITYASNGIVVAFPKSFISKNIKGNVALYRPSNKKMDFVVPISLSESSLLIPKNSLLGGLWDINMEWQYEGKSYLTKETIYIN